ncbi:penicillin-binding transpeptidase domain-containing protein [Leptospira perolatii]|nr:penicillin-binding transpeptidase domain-containing protein [Leptospira perolatii]
MIERKFPPGSIMKPLSSLVLLRHKEAFAFNPKSRIECKGRYYPDSRDEITDFDRRTFHLPKDEKGREYFRCSIAEGHGQVDLDDALVKSCNVYFLTQVAKNPEVFYKKIMDDWKLDLSSASRLKPYSEPNGLSARSFHSLSKLQKITSAIGEGGILLTPIKIAQVYAAIPNGSPFLSPFWKEGDLPIKTEDNEFSKQDQRQVFAILSSVMQNGTLKGFVSESSTGIEMVAAKTGTATKFQKKYSTHGWIASWLRRQGRLYLLLVFVEDGSGGLEARNLASIAIKNIRLSSL